MLPASWVMAALPSTRLDPAARRALLETAATAIEAGLGLTTAEPPTAAARSGVLGEPRASFVTLTIAAELRGCCGSIEPSRPLVLDVWHAAQASAFRDPRFPPLDATEWDSVGLEISVLTPCEPLRAGSEAELLRALVPGRDGLVLEWRGRRVTFLPKVWEQIDDPREFLHLLKRKAGWEAGFWAADLQVWRYETELIAAE
ncbi:MAG: AmmeMemoRadiSam system protein A [Gammaproteobacteria bacterium]|nr:AmmeMemoRadiSam system protein A [Gammaproteobacteria bacterium]